MLVDNPEMLLRFWVVPDAMTSQPPDAKLVSVCIIIKIEIRLSNSINGFLCILPPLLREVFVYHSVHFEKLKRPTNAVNPSSHLLSNSAETLIMRFFQMSMQIQYSLKRVVARLHCCLQNTYKKQVLLKRQKVGSEVDALVFYPEFFPYLIPVSVNGTG